MVGHTGNAPVSWLYKNPALTFVLMPNYMVAVVEFESTPT
nr:MAG TPA: hypothetical protein [Caudoviricetes sp.]